MGEKAARWRRAGAALLALLGGGIASVVASAFLPPAYGPGLFWLGLLALFVCFALLCALQVRLAKDLDPARLDEAQELAASSVRSLLPLWDGLEPALGLVDRLLDAAVSLAASFPWLGGKLQALRPDEVRGVVTGLLAAGPRARVALERLEGGIEGSDPAEVQSALSELKAAAEVLRPSMEAFASARRETP
ncbi:MAG: hypothetical protein HY900_09720, partial [Deltaproteobacteria bacterium]|nr:hypothetical protein [Deltaproteobacteria bacterium]